MCGGLCFFCSRCLYHRGSPMRCASSVCSPSIRIQQLMKHSTLPKTRRSSIENGDKVLEAAEVSRLRVGLHENRGGCAWQFVCFCSRCTHQRGSAMRCAFMNNEEFTRQGHRFILLHVGLTSTLGTRAGTVPVAVKSSCSSERGNPHPGNVMGLLHRAPENIQRHAATKPVPHTSPRRPRSRSEDLNHATKIRITNNVSQVSPSATQLLSSAHSSQICVCNSEYLEAAHT